MGTRGPDSDVTFGGASCVSVLQEHLKREGEAIVETALRIDQGILAAVFTVSGAVKLVISKE